MVPVNVVNFVLKLGERQFTVNSDYPSVSPNCEVVAFGKALKVTY
jgi:hypothetical protein